MNSSLLDIGCGKSSGTCISYVGSCEHSVGIDVFRPDIFENKKKRMHSEYILMDIRAMGFREKSFDTVAAFDVIEHLSKDEGLKLIEDMTKIAKSTVMIYTPNGFMSQEAKDDNKFQIHKSGWDIDIFKEMGFKVIGKRGLRYKFRPRKILAMLEWLSVPFLELFPRFAFHLLCIKNLDNEDC